MAKTIIKTALVLLAISIAGFATFLLIRGAPFTSVEEGAPLSEAITIYERPYLPALFPILGSVLVLWGGLNQKMIIAWLGAGFLMVFSVMFVFSWGGIFFVPCVVLVVLLLVYHLFYQRKRPLPS